jgi:ATP-dependent Clp protease ATP-binding subunit ClpB
VIQRYLENPLALAVLEGKVGDGSTVPVSAGEDGLVIDGRKIKEAA